jgi:hypothetical protein
MDEIFQALIDRTRAPLRYAEKESHSMGSRGRDTYVRSEGVQGALRQNDTEDYGPRRAAFDLKKLRGKGMVRKIGTSSRYAPESDGLRAITALAVLREQGHQAAACRQPTDGATDQAEPSNTTRP